MSPEFVISYAREAITLAIMLASPILLAALLIGLAVSIFQAVTQIQEMTLAIIPKMMVVVLVIMLMFPWFLSKATTFMTRVFTNFPMFVGFGG